MQRCYSVRKKGITDAEIERRVKTRKEIKLFYQNDPGFFGSVMINRYDVPLDHLVSQLDDIYYQST